MTSKTHDNPHPCSWCTLRLFHLLCRLNKRGHVRATEQPGPNDHACTLERDKYRFVDFVPRVPGGPELLVSAQTRVMGHVYTRENNKLRFLELPSQPWHGRPVWRPVWRPRLAPHLAPRLAKP